MQVKTNDAERQLWKDWIWEQYTSGNYGNGFRPCAYMTPAEIPGKYSEYDTPHLIMTYTALLSLAILRDDFSKLDRPGILKFLRACQQDDGSFSALPSGAESDLRAVYCAFVVSSMLDDWSGIDIDRAVEYIKKCSSHEGGYGQTPFGEALGGTTYCALASLHLAPSTPSSPRESRVTPSERSRTVRWLVQNQTASGGFRGRTNKDADACYCFWCGASLGILGASDLVDSEALASFLAQCQHKFGGIAKAIGERSDPYHTYLSLAALALIPPSADASWQLPQLDALWNAKDKTVRWVRDHVPDRSDGTPQEH
ncbi:Geranylgeranyl transferase type-1 subunit beta [Sparassis crispa]|uniref:Geranylgeranyl transferase type-1 subunit beta n=1 Tax=Sparassis crispa TaxID=139825 RepID=A0A401GS96_9APHY|nr:Geranylgeranyl transferase type-1 subunit beta [Sparassis crispa]GBE85095.1 Geranylgeranyl transferase type-1 subunit beta [Sparassis crispa]